MECEIPQCTNQDYQGKFIGNLCTPCHTFLQNKVDEHLKKPADPSRAYLNEIDIAKFALKDCDHYLVEQKYK